MSHFLENHAGKVLVAAFVVPVVFRFVAFALFSIDELYDGGPFVTPGERREMQIEGVALVIFLVMAALAGVGYTMRRERRQREGDRQGQS